MSDSLSSLPVKVVGRYAIYEEIASGGMATVHFGRLLGPVGFSRTVAIKRLHAQYVKDPEFVSMLLDEARLAARIRHPNVVPTLDVVAAQGELFVVMEYVLGESLGRLVRVVKKRGERIPLNMVTSIISGALSGLHAAHEATSERGEPLGIVHRDISPQNIIVGQDGIARVLDFGVAKAVGRIQSTREGQIKGKLAYMAPEQIQNHVSRQTDVFAVSIVLWELLTGKRLFAGGNEGAVLFNVLSAKLKPPSAHVPEAAPFDDVVMKGLQRDRSKRFATAKEMARALETCSALASPTEVGEWVEQVALTSLQDRAKKVSEIETWSSQDAKAADLANLVSQSAVTTVRPAQDSSDDSLADVTIDSDDFQRALEEREEQDEHRQSGAPSESVVSDVQDVPPARSLRRVRWGVLLVPCLVLVALFAYWRRGAPQTPSPAHVPSASVSVLESATTVQSARSPASPSLSVPAPHDDARATASATASAPPSAPPVKRAAPPATTRARPSNERPAGCDPPYVFDAAGRKKWKPECVGN